MAKAKKPRARPVSTAKPRSMAKLVHVRLTGITFSAIAKIAMRERRSIAQTTRNLLEDVTGTIQQ